MALGPRPRQRVRIVPQVVFSLVASAALFVLLTLPPKAVRLPAGPSSGPVVYGGYHVHSIRSDGTGSPDEIAAAAARAGLSFILLTDHGDGTRVPDPPQYRHGVLCLDALEVSTAAGHVVALGLNGPAPYPLAGEANDVIDDIHRLGGWAVIAHPDSPKPELRWRAMNTPSDGIEWLNVDSEWRDETAARLTATVARYLIRPPETIVSLFQRPVATLRRWDAVARVRPVVGLAALDAHARIPWRAGDEPRWNRTVAARPTYEEMFRTLVQAAVLDRPLSGNASLDAPRLLGALHAAHAFSVINGIAGPASVNFTATTGAATISMGDRVSIPSLSGAPIAFHARVPEAPSARVVLVHNGADVVSGRGSVEFSGTVSPGPYRIEVYYPGATVPWIVSNPIYTYAGDPAVVSLPGPAASLPPPVRLAPIPGASGWAIERDPTSSATAVPDRGGSQVTFALGPGIPSGQYAAVVASVDGSLSQEGFDRVQFTVRADRPMRVSVQLRLPGGRDGQRWRLSVYADQTARDVVLNLQDFQPTGFTTSQRPIVAHVRSVLFVVDTLNTSPGTKGTVWLSNGALGVGNAER